MTRRPHPDFLRLVHSDITPESELSEPRGTGYAQDSFLPSNQPNTLLFLAWDKASIEDLMDVFELSSPKLILDMRVAPRFDLGQLTRRRFFDLLRKYDCQYVDLFGRMGVDNVSGAVLNPALVAAQAAKFTERLLIPNNGPLVFLHDDDLVDDAYVSALAKALPCGIRSGWQVYRPLGSPDIRADKKRTDQIVPDARDISAAAPLARHAVFISHATPEDNAFVMWLASKLAFAGYDVWCDITNLSGGDGFWKNIEDVIRLRAAKVIFVQSEHVKRKAGARKEAYLALKVGERNRLPRFVVPMRIDATPFDETLIELIDLQAIDCRRDWLSGLKSLLSLLQRDGVPRASSFKADLFSSLVGKFGQPALSMVRSKEQTVSNLLPILALPQQINFFSCSGIQASQLPGIASRISIPAFAYYTHIVTTAARNRFSDALATLGLEDLQIRERASLSWTDFLAANCGDLPTWKRSEARNNAFGMLNKAWSQYVLGRGVSVGSLANERPFWYYKNGHFSDNKVRFSDYSGKTIRRQLVGFSAKRRVYWHFATQSRCFTGNEGFFFALTPHVTFSSDGEKPLPSKAQLHSLRRSFCRSWWNDRWRDLMQGFVAALAGGEKELEVDIGAEAPLRIDASFSQFSSPVSLVSANLVRPVEDVFADDEVEDEWEDDVDDEDGAVIDTGDVEVTAEGA